MSKKLIPRNIRLTLVITVLTLLSACSSAPVSLRHYLLDQKLEAYQSKSSEAEISLSLQRIKLARYLQQSQLAILQQNNQLHFASQHVWAEELNHGISRSLINDLNLEQDIYAFSANEPGHAQSQYQLEVQIDHLVATDDAKVILAGKLWLMEQQKLKTSAPFYFEQDLQQDGFSHSVKQQRQLLSQLAQKIAQLIKL